jgi:hypothetical protein
MSPLGGLAVTDVSLTAVRHPLDPDPVRSSKAVAVLILGITAAVTGFFVGGLIPATLALLLAREVDQERLAARGFLTGRRAVRIGVALAWVGVVLAAAALVILAIIGLLRLSDSAGGSFGPNVN